MVEHPPFKREAVSSSLTERKSFWLLFQESIRPLRLSARTPDFQSGERSSILLGGVFFCFGFCVYRALQPRSDTSACRPFTVYSSSVAPTLNAKSSQKYLFCNISHSREFLSGISTYIFLLLIFLRIKDILIIGFGPVVSIGLATVYPFSRMIAGDWEAKSVFILNNLLIYNNKQLAFCEGNFKIIF